MLTVYLPKTRRWEWLRRPAFLSVGSFAFSLLSSMGDKGSAFFSLWFFSPPGTFEDSSLYSVAGVWSLSVMDLVGNLLLLSLLI